ncbi:cytosolic purine 5'-nucleotidase [Elysia marginata]|uniref:Cytosolic purine 5'-nucleotidase n=1 Tax=Elysia marginata TaxID=1093978 RepID=A0AAV4GBH5_9GAST|nr:cytosolic purine 5'-nucleotidase [Elysia marginata]
MQISAHKSCQQPGEVHEQDYFENVTYLEDLLIDPDPSYPDLFSPVPVGHYSYCIQTADYRPTKMSTSETKKAVQLRNGHRENEKSHELKVFKREPQHRIFVNRGLHLDKIKFYGFDMDYTLAVYKSPVYETMSFDLLKKRLIHRGYPEAIKQFEYKPSFPVRGLWFDKKFGNLLKVDSHGNILVCVHGFKFLKSHEVSELYPNKYIQLDEKRVYILNTLFNIPETYMLACIIDYFASHKDFQHTSSKQEVSSGTIHMSYKSIFQDIRDATDWLHIHETIERMVVKVVVHSRQNSCPIICAYAPTPASSNEDRNRFYSDLDRHLKATLQNGKHHLLGDFNT